MAAGAARRPGGNRSPEHVPGGCGHGRQLPDRSCCGKGFRFHRMLAPGRAPLAGLIELVYGDKAAPQISLMPFGSSPKPVSIGSRHPRLIWSQLPASSKSNGAGAPLDRESQVRSGLVGGGSGSQRTRWWREIPPDRTPPGSMGINTCLLTICNSLSYCPRAAIHVHHNLPPSTNQTWANLWVDNILDLE
jgi:hypothetical protein